MATTSLDPKTALIVIDLQKGIVSRPGIDRAGEVVERAATLAGAFRRHGLPVVLVNVVDRPPGRTEQSFGGGAFPPGFADLIPQLNQQPQDHLISKRTPGAFTHTDLESYLKQAGVTQLVIVGISTSIGVESTARQAYELGFNVTLAVDAMTDLNAETHANSVTHIFPRLGETGTTQNVIDLLGSLHK